jgi:carbon-monoxide dehydrogenase medium subunit
MMGAAVQPQSYVAARSLDEALAALSTGARAIAGGTDLLPRIRSDLKPWPGVVDLKTVPDLVGVEVLADGRTRIGAATSITALARNRHLVQSCRALVAAGRMIGSLQIQSRASLGGNVCNAAPSADAVPALVALGAVAEIVAPGGKRSVLVEALFTGPGRTVLAANELLAALVLPPPAPRSAACYLRFTPRREMDIAIAGSGTWLRLDDRGAVAEARVALASVAPTPIRAPSAEQALIGQSPSAEVFRKAAEGAAADARPISDTRGSADYRRELVRVLTGRALAAAVADLGLGIDMP